MAEGEYLSYGAIAGIAIGGTAVIACCCFLAASLIVCCIACCCFRRRKMRNRVEYYRGLPVNVKSRTGQPLGLTTVTPDGVEVIISREGRDKSYSNPYIPPAQNGTASSPPPHSTSGQTLTRQETSYTSVCSTSYALEMAKSETLQRMEATN